MSNVGISTPKLYADRDIIGMDKAGGYYLRHVSAMTAEGLHSKSDIAAELAWRDQQIDRLQALIDDERMRPIEYRLDDESPRS